MNRVIKKIRSQIEGSALVATLIFCTVAAMGVGSLLLLQSTSYRMSHKSYEGNRALYLAEAGVALALDELNKHTTPFTGSSDFNWSSSGNVYTLTRSDIGNIEVEVDYSNANLVVIRSRGEYQSIKKGIELKAARSTADPMDLTFPGAIAALSDVDCKNNVLVDSYDDGSYDAGNDYGYHGDIFSRGASIKINAGAKVRGHVYYANTAASINHGGEIYWDANDEATTNNRNPEIGDFRDFKPATVPPHLLMSGTAIKQIQTGDTLGPGHYTGNNNLGNFTLTGGFYKIDGDLDIGNSGICTISGDSDIYITGNLNMGNGAEMINWVGDGTVVDGITDVYSLRLFVGGDIVFGNGNITNPQSNYDCSLLQIFGLGKTGTDIDIKNGGLFIGTIYAPQYTVDLTNSNEIFGAFAVTLISPKNGALIHFDERLWGLIDGTPAGKYGAASWKEL
jgi:Tfp pilus assembly protein PilX